MARRWNWILERAHGRQHAYAMTLTFAGRHEFALATMQLARQLDPLSPIISTNLGRVLYNARRYEEAVEQLQWTVRHAPDTPIAHHRLGLALDAVHRRDDAIRELECAQELSGAAPAPTASRLACTYAIHGRRADAERALNALLARSRTEYVAAPCIAELYVALGDHDRAFEWLEKAVGTERSSMLVTIQTSHRYDPVRVDSRFGRLVERVGILVIRRTIATCEFECRDRSRSCASVRVAATPANSASWGLQQGRARERRCGDAAVNAGATVSANRARQTPYTRPISISVPGYCGLAGLGTLR